MIFPTFHNYIKQLNPDLYIDVNNRVFLEHPDFPVSGLYIRNGSERGLKYVMAIPQEEVHEYTIVGIDRKKLAHAGFPVVDANKFFDSDYIETIKASNPEAIGEYPLAKGYRSILAELAALDLIDVDRCYKIFGITPERNRKIFPKRYMAIDVPEAKKPDTIDYGRVLWNKESAPLYFT